jgi:hypothetical protein
VRKKGRQVRLKQIPMQRRNDTGHVQRAPLFGPDDPVRLKLAAEAFFPDGTMGESGLRSEARRGRLVTWRIAGKDYTSFSKIEEMKAQCRSVPRVQGSISEQQRAKNAAHGSSAMEADQSALDALLLNAQRLSKGLPTISTPSTSRTAAEVVVPLKSRLPTC